MNIKLIAAALSIVFVTAVKAQNKEDSTIRQADTVIVPLAKTSKIVFTIEDRNDLEILKHYNFQDLFEDILKRLENTNPVSADSSKSENEVVAQQDTETEDWRTDEENEDGKDEDGDRWSSKRDEDGDEDEDDDDWGNNDHYRRSRIGRTWQSTNVDFGINNYLSKEGQFPESNELYAVRPWGSWYVGVNSMQRTRVGRNFFIEWGIGVSWYNFKFQQDDIIIGKDAETVTFTAAGDPELDYIKSKLRVTHLNISLIPLLDFGDHSRKPRMWDGYGSEFRIGIGPYAGYKIGSKSKLVYKDGGDREKDKHRDSFYLNDLRYGARLQLGFRSTDFFFNYDFNDLFKKDRGPELNAISFGVIF